METCSLSWSYALGSRKRGEAADKGDEAVGSKARAHTYEVCLRDTHVEKPLRKCLSHAAHSGRAGKVAVQRNDPVIGPGRGQQGVAESVAHLLCSRVEDLLSHRFALSISSRACLSWSPLGDLAWNV